MNERDSEELASLMKSEVERALASIGTDDHPHPFYLSFLVRDEESWEIAAAFGALTVDSRARRRHGYCDVRVGSHEHDQVQDGGLDDNSTEEESYKAADLPIGGDTAGLQHALWRLAEVRYREAVEALASKKASELTHLDRTKSWPSFERRTAASGKQFSSLPEVDRDAWRHFVERASACARLHPKVKDSKVTLKALNQLRILVDSEGSQQTPRSLAGALHDNSETPYYLGTRDPLIERWDNRFKGVLDEVRIYDRSLDPAEVLALAESGLESVE